MVVTLKPYRDMSLTALSGELAIWTASIEAHVWGRHRPMAERWRDECAIEIARRQHTERAA